MRFPTFSTPFSFSIQLATFVPVQIPPSAGLNFNSCANFSSCFSFKRDFLPPRDSRCLFLIFFTPSDDNSLDFSNNSQPLSPVGLWLSAPKGQTAINQRLNKGLNIF